MSRSPIRIELATIVLGVSLLLLGAWFMTSPMPVLAESLAPVPTNPNAPASGDLVEHPRTWEGQTIPFRGEAVGEAMIRGDEAWLHLNDDAYYLRNVEEGAALAGYNSGMAVFLPSGLARRVRVFGDYKHEGDIVEVVGQFNAACPEHGGDMDIHAVSLRVVTPGHDAIDRVHPWKMALAAALSLFALLLWQAERRLAKRLAQGAVTRLHA